jgi:serine/threonine protein kinase
MPQDQLVMNQRELVQRIREIKIQSFLDHPHIVQLYSVFVEENNLYLLMELCSDGTLYECLRREGIFSEERIKTVIRQVCYAVEYMHDNDILHRDLKP